MSGMLLSSAPAQWPSERTIGLVLAARRACRGKKVPVLVRTVLSMLLPVSLSTTVDLTMVGLACATHNGAAQLCSGHTLQATLSLTRSARTELAEGRSCCAELLERERTFPMR